MILFLPFKLGLELRLRPLSWAQALPGWYSRPGGQNPDRSTFNDHAAGNGMIVQPSTIKVLLATAGMATRRVGDPILVTAKPLEVARHRTLSNTLRSNWFWRARLGRATDRARSGSAEQPAQWPGSRNQPAATGQAAWSNQLWRAHWATSSHGDM